MIPASRFEVQRLSLDRPDDSENGMKIKLKPMIWPLKLWSIVTPFLFRTDHPRRRQKVI